MLFLAVAQAIGLADMLGGPDIDVDLDTDIGPESDAISAGGPMDGLLSLIGIGRVPFTIWLAAFLLVFALLGVSIQGFAESLTGGPLYSWLAALIAGGVALPVTGVIARPIAHIMPQDETTAVKVQSLLGRRATIQTGTARTGSPARAQVRDRFGHAHLVMVEPHHTDDALEEGEMVLLVRREGGNFIAARLEERRLSPAD